MGDAAEDAKEDDEKDTTEANDEGAQLAGELECME